MAPPCRCRLHPSNVRTQSRASLTVAANAVWPYRWWAADERVSCQRQSRTRTEPVACLFSERVILARALASSLVVTLAAEDGRARTIARTIGGRGMARPRKA